MAQFRKFLDLVHPTVTTERHLSSIDLAHVQSLNLQCKVYESLESAVERAIMGSGIKLVLEIEKERLLTGIGYLIDFPRIRNNGEKGTNEVETKPCMNEAQFFDEQQTRTKEEQSRSARINKREKKSPIPLELTNSLRGIPNVKSFDVIGKEITIHVLQGHEEEAKDGIEEARNKHAPALNYRIKTFRKTDYIELHSESVGGDSILRCFPDLVDARPINGTIGCFLKLQKAERSDSEKNYDGNIYAVTCHHVAEPKVNENSILFKTTTNDGQTKEFSREIEWYLLDEVIPADIALIPVKESCDVFNFQHDDCIKYTGDKKRLVGKNVQKQGAKSKLTKGKIVSVISHVGTDGTDGEDLWFCNVIKVESTELDNKPFSVGGDSGSLVTLSRNTGDKTHQAVSIVFAGGVMNGKQVSYTFDLFEATDKLLKKSGIDNKYDILSNFGAGPLHAATLDS